MKSNVLKLLSFIPVFLLMLSVPSYAEGEQRLFDDAGYFSAGEAERLNTLLLVAEESCGFYVSVLVTDSIGADKENTAAKKYADIYYDEKFGVDTDGILYMVNLDTGYDCISTSGHATRIFTDWVIEDVFNYVWDDMLDERFYDGMVKFCEVVRLYAILGVPEGQYNFDADTYETDYYTEPSEWDFSPDNDDEHDYYSYGGYEEELVFGFFSLENGLAHMAFGGIAGAIIAVIIIITVLSRYKIKPVKGATDYLDKKSVRYHQQTDTFIRQYVTARKIESSNGGSRGGGGGRSTTHRSSSGGTHGGGGRGR